MSGLAWYFNSCKLEYLPLAAIDSKHEECTKTLSFLFKSILGAWCYYYCLLSFSADTSDKNDASCILQWNDRLE